MTKQLYRMPNQGKFTGVAAGLAEYFDIDPTIIRLLFVAGALVTSGWAAIIYLILAIVLPVEGHESVDINTRFNELVNSPTLTQSRNWVGGGLIAIGGWYLLSHLWPEWLALSWGFVGPLALVLIGLLIITKGRR